MRIERFDDDRFNDECAVFGIYGNQEAANVTYLGLYALQHRGQESSGIVTSDGSDHYVEIGMGLVADIFTPEKISALHGNIAIGHNRYSTTGDSLLKNAQPLATEFAMGSMAMAHNGNLVNSSVIRTKLEDEGSIFRSTMDTEVLAHLIAKSPEIRFSAKVVDALLQVQGAYCLVIMTEDELIAVRDPQGFRPLAMGTLKGAPVFASETCAFDLIGAEYVRDVAPGEMIVVNESGVKSFFPFPVKPQAKCVFEFIYLARPDSIVFGKTVHTVRKELGRELARQYPVDADLVIAVPDSGVPAAIGFAEESGIPFDTGMIRNHYVGRTFIEPSQSIRNFGVKIKLNPISELIRGKRVVVVDDSIVRGTTCRKITAMVRSAGAKEVHMRISSPPTVNPCYYGIDTPTKEELIASSSPMEDIRDYLKCDTLGYLGHENLLAIFGKERTTFCTACFGGKYPVPLPGMEIHQSELFEGLLKPAR